MDVLLNNEEFIKCKRSVIIYLEVYCSQACAYCSRSWLSVLPGCHAVLALGSAWFGSAWISPEPVFFFAEAHLGSRCARPESTVPLPGGGPGDSPLEQGQDKTLCDIPGVYFSECPPPLRASDTFVLPKLP